MQFILEQKHIDAHKVAREDGDGDLCAVCPVAQCILETIPNMPLPYQVRVNRESVRICDCYNTISADGTIWRQELPRSIRIWIDQYDMGLSPLLPQTFELDTTDIPKEWFAQPVSEVQDNV